MNERILLSFLTNDAKQSWLEFKCNNETSEMTGKFFSAISNAARVEGRDVAKQYRASITTLCNAVGTDFSPANQRAGNQVFSMVGADVAHPAGYLEAEVKRSAEGLLASAFKGKNEQFKVQVVAGAGFEPAAFRL